MDTEEAVTEVMSVVGPIGVAALFQRRVGWKRKGKWKSGGKGWSRFSFLAEMPDQEYDEVFCEGKGSSKGKRRSFAKGKGRRTNPRGRDGEVMKCSQRLPSGATCN